MYKKERFIYKFLNYVKFDKLDKIKRYIKIYKIRS